MAHFSTDSLSQRPGMRRKSSAQNLLSSFKSGPSSIPPPLNLAPSSPVINAAPFSAGVTPSTTPLVRESHDAQPSYLDNVVMNLQNAPSSQPGQGTSVEYLRDLVQKRIITLTYIRSIHEGWVTFNSKWSTWLQILFHVSCQPESLVSYCISLSSRTRKGL